jgi:hypothetical protein
MASLVVAQIEGSKTPPPWGRHRGRGSMTPCVGPGVDERVALLASPTRGQEAAATPEVNPTSAVSPSAISSFCG